MPVSDDSPQLRWREIGREMADDADWQNGVQALALTLHDAAERLSREELKALADDTTGRLFQRVADESKQMGRGLTEAQIDDLVSALFWAAFDFADTFAPRVTTAS